LSERTPEYRTGSVIEKEAAGIPEAKGFLPGLFGPQSPELVSEALNIPTLTKGIGEQLQIAKPTEKLIKGDLEKLLDPRHEENLRQIEVNAMLNDLMANDEVISGHEPESVLRVFNEISQLAPRTSHQKMLIRALLRKRLQYGGDQVDPFEVQQLLDVENKLKERDSRGRSPGGLYEIGMMEP